MKIKNVKIGLVGVGTVLFHALFWKESLGVNLLLFSLYLIIGNGLLKETDWNKKILVTLVGLILNLGAVFFIHSTISLIAAFTSLIVFTGFIHHQKLRSNWSSLLTIFISFFQVPKLDLTNKELSKYIDLKKWKKKFKLFILPLIVVFLFSLIYRMANPVFDSYLYDFENWIGSFIGNLFERLSLSSLLFFIVGFFLTGALLIKSSRTYFVKRDALKSVTIIRERRTKRTVNNHFMSEGNPRSNLKFPMIPVLGLKNERYSAIVMLSLVGLLLFIVNSIDIIYVWFNKATDTSKSLTEMVHEGTYLLIFSILLSMLIMLYIFRRNQNFYPKSNLLKQLSYAWIIQNGILVISVAIRNHNYITEYGLTHKRIGVYLFLLTTVVGLVFLYLKIKNKKSIYYLVLSNSWFVYVLMVLMGMVNWDGLIATYNISYVNKNQVDYRYLTDLSDNALIAIDKNKEFLNVKMWNGREYGNGRMSPSEKFEAKVLRIKNNKPQSALSWNYSTYRIQAYFKTK